MTVENDENSEICTIIQNGGIGLPGLVKASAVYKSTLMRHQLGRIGTCVHWHKNLVKNDDTPGGKGCPWSNVYTLPREAPYQLTSLVLAALYGTHSNMIQDIAAPVVQT